MKKGEIEKYRHDLEVVRMTAEQLKKDFAMHGLEIKFSGNEQTAYDELIVQVTPLLQKLFKENRAKLMQLLYRVDIPERDWKKVLSMENKDAQAEKLSAVILEREFMKALTRKMFSGR
jgi:hypothetical protein